MLRQWFWPFLEFTCFPCICVVFLPGTRTPADFTDFILKFPETVTWTLKGLRLWVPVLVWFLKTLLNIVREPLRWAKSPNVLELLHICSCDAAAHWHLSSSEGSLGSVKLWECENTQCCKTWGRYFHARSSHTMPNLSCSPKIYPCAERKIGWQQNLHP